MKEITAMEVNGIKLFGKKISYPEFGKMTDVPAASIATDTAAAAEEFSDGGDEHGGSHHRHGLTKEEKICVEEERINREESEKDQQIENKQEDDSSPMAESDGNPRTPIDEDTAKAETEGDATDSRAKTLKKPDKILPCPRCNSMDTKFCYYNNYNVNQPRHFCKSCQRYWTAGGTMRNTPVGSGRRKNKSSSSAAYYRHLIVSEALQGPHHSSLKTSGSVLNFGSDVPLCESMNSALNFSNKSQRSEDELCSSSASNSAEKGGDNGLKNFQGYPLQIPCFPAPPWSYTWNLGRPPMVPPTNLGPLGYPVSFYPPPPYWGCTVQPNPWSTPWVTPQNDQFAPTSPLGKHSRDWNLLSPSSKSRNEEFSSDKDSESGVLIPKTLRINNPNEAAKSSLWSTLGISKDEHNNNNNNPINGGTLYKAFQSKGDEKIEVAENSLVNLQANPAALSRSLNFRETS